MHGQLKWLEHSAWIGRLGVRVSLRSKHFLSQKLRHFHKDIRSWVENECCCSRTINMLNSNVTIKIHYQQNHNQGPQGWPHRVKLSCLVELHNGLRCIDYGLLHISEKFRSTVSYFNWEMPILLGVGLRGYVHYKKSLSHIMWLYNTTYFMDDIHKITQR